MRNRKGGAEGQRLADEYNKAAYAVGEWKPEDGEIVVGGPHSLNGMFACVKLGESFYFICDGKVMRHATIHNQRPSTKSDRDTFFIALNKIGYEYDSKKMKLKKKEIVEEFKDGAFIKCSWSGKTGICILNGEYRGEFSELRSHVQISDDCSIKFYNSFGTIFKRIDEPASDSEIQLLLDAMHSVGRDWDFTNKRVVDYDPADSSGLKVGDKVWSFIHGEWGIVGDINNELKCYPISVKFDDGRVYKFTKEGAFLMDGYQVLFKQPMKAVVK